MRGDREMGVYVCGVTSSWSSPADDREQERGKGADDYPRQ